MRGVELHEIVVEQFALTTFLFTLPFVSGCLMPECVGCGVKVASWREPLQLVVFNLFSMAIFRRRYCSHHLHFGLCPCPRIQTYSTGLG